MATKAFRSLWFCLGTAFLTLQHVSADIVVQGQNCGTQRDPLIVRMTTYDEEVIVSHAGTDHYASSYDCIVTLLGKQYYQFQIELRMIDIDSRRYVSEHCKGLCCYDYLKMYNGYRVDNARLFPTIGWQGLCGTELPRRTSFTTSQNYVTIQFRTDEIAEPMRGFVLKILQFPRRNDGNINPEGGYIGGWNDGSLNELQLDWIEQEQIPSDLIPGGGDNDFGTETGGVSCYECFGCRIAYYDPDSSTDRSSKRSGCYVCSKEYQDGIARANRRCYSRLQYSSLMLTLTDTSTGSGEVKEWRGCRKFSNIQGIFVNYCICDSGNYCNGAGKMPMNSVVLAMCLILSLAKYLKSEL